MPNEILNTADLTEQVWDGESEPSELETDMVALKEPEGHGMEFHVQMRGYTLRDMDDLIVNAAAAQIMGSRNEREMAKLIEAKCIEQITAKADAALLKVAAEIIEQPLIPSFGSKEPVTMREFIGLTGRDYLTTRVDNSDKPTPNDSWGRSNSPTRIERLVSKYMDQAFKKEIEKATNAAINEVRAAVKAHHDAFLEAEKARFREAMASTVAPAKVVKS